MATEVASCIVGDDKKDVLGETEAEIITQEEEDDQLDEDDIVDDGVEEGQVDNTLDGDENEEGLDGDENEEGLDGVEEEQVDNTLDGDENEEGLDDDENEEGLDDEENEEGLDADENEEGLDGDENEQDLDGDDQPSIDTNINKDSTENRNIATDSAGDDAPSDAKGSVKEQMDSATNDNKDANQQMDASQKSVFDAFKDVTQQVGRVYQNFTPAAANQQQQPRQQRQGAQRNLQGRRQARQKVSLPSLQEPQPMESVPTPQERQPMESVSTPQPPTQPQRRPQKPRQPQKKVSVTPQAQQPQQQPQQKESVSPPQAQARQTQQKAGVPTPQEQQPMESVSTPQPPTQPQQRPQKQRQPQKKVSVTPQTQQPQQQPQQKESVSPPQAQAQQTQQKVGVPTPQEQQPMESVSTPQPPTQPQQRPQKHRQPQKKVSVTPQAQQSQQQPQQKVSVSPPQAQERQTQQKVSVPTRQEQQPIESVPTPQEQQPMESVSTPQPPTQPQQRPQKQRQPQKKVSITPQAQQLQEQPQQKESVSPPQAQAQQQVNPNKEPQPQQQSETQANPSVREIQTIPSGAVNLPTPAEDATTLYTAFKGRGCDVGRLVHVLTKRDGTHRDLIQQHYKKNYGEDLSDRISSELSKMGDFKEKIGLDLTVNPTGTLSRTFSSNIKRAVSLWMLEESERDATIVRQAMQVTSFDKAAVTEVICSRTPSQLRNIQRAYYTKFSSQLLQEINSSNLRFNGHHKELLIACLDNQARDEGTNVDLKMAEEDAKQLYQDGEKIWGTNETTFINIFTKRNRPHLVAVDAAYHKLYGHSLEKAVEKETTRSFQDGLLTLLRCAKNPAKYFAEVLYNAMKGIGTSDTTLIRTVVTRASIDMEDIKKEYAQAYNISLKDAIQKDTSGDYRTFLISLIE